MDAVLHFDGASRGNPGEAAAAFVIELPDRTVTDAIHLGEATNNEAEYAAVVAGLQRAYELGATNLTVHGDSELVIKQLQEEYAVRAENLQPYYKEAKDLFSQFSNIRTEHVPRSDNQTADSLTESVLGDKAE